MNPTVHCHCPECGTFRTDSIASTRVPVPAPDRAQQELLDGADMSWVCPDCERTFRTTIIPDSDDWSIPWVGIVEDALVCIDISSDARDSISSIGARR